MIYLPYTDIIKVAGVRLPAHLWWCGAVGFGLTQPPHFLLIHDAFDAFPEFFQRFALLNEFEDCFQQRLGHVHFVHSPHSFL
nr:MAG TPA: hypothetical protein [Caudoviricetes sp.]